jgi:predicted O-linked N-acetylglucosamine transferase (SPINDLY family)
MYNQSNLILPVSSSNTEPAAADSFRRGAALQEQKQYEAALECFQTACTLKPDYAEAWWKRGNVLQSLKRHQLAVESYEQAIALKPDYAEAYSNCGIALQKLSRYAAALASFKQAIALKPDYANAYNNCGLAFKDLGQFAEELQCYEQAIALKPDFAEAHYNRGNCLQYLERYAEALASYDQAIALRPDHVNACHNHGNTLLSLKRYAEALLSFERVIALKPDHVEAHCNRGFVLNVLQRCQTALESIEQVVALRPDWDEAYNNRGIILQNLKCYDLALASFERAISLNPDYALAHYNLGLAHYELGQYQVALNSFDKAVTLKPDYVEAYYSRANTLEKLEKLLPALQSFEQAIALKPDYADAYTNLGLICIKLRRYETALASFTQVLAFKPDHPDAYINQGSALQKLERYEEALLSYEQAIALQPDYAKAYKNLGSALLNLKRYAEVTDNYRHALALAPDYEYLLGEYLHTKLKACDWRNIEQEFVELTEKLALGAKVSFPFNVLAITDNPALQHQAAKIWATEKNLSRQHLLPKIPKLSRRGKIRLAYFSADFRNHPVAILTAQLFEKHDRNRFEIIAFSYCNEQDDMRTRLEAGFDRFIDVCDLSDIEVAQLSRSLEIDIAVDLGGYTGGYETKAFGLRVAPLQVSYLGYSGTLGVDFMDYLIADGRLIPAAGRVHYSEKIVQLPHSYLVNDSNRAISDKHFSREDFGLPVSGFVFCCFNNAYKLNPNVFNCWMRILSQVEGSVFWLAVNDPNVAVNLTREAAAYGIGLDRLIFTQRLPRQDEHLARLRLADLFLDTLPYNAHATTSDALWAGLPVLTCPGEAYAARVAASLLTAIGLPELIAQTPAQYEAIAIELATHPDKLAGIRSKLAQNRLATPLFDTDLFTGHLEAAYTLMYERYQADLPPEHIDV